MPQAYQTMMMGKGLSGGQKQRLLIESVTVTVNF